MSAQSIIAAFNELKDRLQGVMKYDAKTATYSIPAQEFIDSINVIQDAALACSAVVSEGQAVAEALVARMQAITTAGFELGAALTNVPEATGPNPEDFIRRDAVMALVVEWREKMDAAPKVDLRAALSRPAAPTPEALRPIPTNSDTDGMEAGRIIGRLMSSDPDFDDCADAASLIHKLIIEKQGADGQAVAARDLGLKRHSHHKDQGMVEDSVGGWVSFYELERVLSCPAGPAPEAPTATPSARTLPPLPEMESLADVAHTLNTPDDWDADYCSIWQRLQVVERNKMQWRAYAHELRTILAAATAPTADQAPEVAASLQIWSHSEIMGVMIPDSPREVSRQRYYKCEDVDALLTTQPKAAPVAEAPTDPETKQARLLALADRIDHEKLWRLAGMDHDKLTNDQKDRMQAGVMLRRYADIWTPGHWIVVPPTGSVQYGASTLDKAVGMAKKDESRHAAATATEQAKAKPAKPKCQHAWHAKDGQADIDGSCIKCGLSFQRYIHTEMP